MSTKKSVAETIAEEICSVQPMPSDCLRNLYEAAMTTEELVSQGYQPVSRLGLMWIKKENLDGEMAEEVPPASPGGGDVVEGPLDPGRGGGGR